MVEYSITKGNLTELYNVGEILQTKIKKWIFVHAEEFNAKNTLRAQGSILWIKIGDRYIEIEFDNHAGLFIYDDKIAFVSHRCTTRISYDKIWILEE